MPMPSTVRSSRPESGSTLIEVVVALAIMGIAFVIIVGGIATAILGADIQEQQAGADVALRSTAEAIAYVPCPATGEPDYAGQLPTITDFALAVTDVSYWDPDTNKFQPGSICLDSGLHLIELRATSLSGRAASPKTLQVVKRRP